MPLTRSRLSSPMFKRLRRFFIIVFVVGVGAVAYHYLGNPAYQRKIVQTAQEVREDLRDEKKQRWSGTVVVVEAVDGDKLLVNTETSQKVKVSLVGIDAPELGVDRLRPGQPLAEESRQYLSQLTTNQAADMAIVATDASKRPLVLLTVDGALVNAKMVAAGLAEVTAEETQNIPVKLKHEIENAELTARQNRLGIWALTNHVRPVEYRIRQR
jgi:micrococcal nuclease